MSADGAKNLDVTEQEIRAALSRVLPSLVEEVLQQVVRDATERAIRLTRGRVD